MRVRVQGSVRRAAKGLGLGGKGHARLTGYAIFGRSLRFCRLALLRPIPDQFENLQVDYIRTLHVAAPGAECE